MTEWIDTIAADAMTNGEHIVVDVDGTDVVLFKLDDEFYALEDVCSHDGTEIASGEVQDGEIICPRHGARFCIKTGQVKSPPAYEPISCFEVRKVDGKVQIKAQ